MPEQFLPDLTFNCSVNQDNQYFCEVFGNNWYKYFALIFSSVFVCFAAYISFAAVWYEVSESSWNKTIISELSKLIHLFGVFGLLGTYVIDLSRYLYGPLNQHVCFLQVVFKNSIKTEVLLFLDANIIARYLLIFHCNNPLAIDYGFWSTFLGTCILTLSSVFNFSIFFVADQQPINYYICTDIDPRSFMRVPQKRVGYVEIISLIIHIFLKIRICIFKSKTNALILQNSNKFNDYTFNDFAINLILILVMVFYEMVNQKISSFNLISINQFPNYLFVYYFHLFGPCSISLTVGMFYYGRNKFLRTFAWKKVSRLFSIS